MLHYIFDKTKENLTLNQIDILQNVQYFFLIF